MYLNYEIHLFLQLIDDYEPNLVKIIKYYIKTYTFKTDAEFKHIIDKLCLNQCNFDYIYSIKYWDVSNIDIYGRGVLYCSIF